MTRRATNRPRKPRKDSWNEGARLLEAERARLGETVEVFGARFERDRTYMGRILSGEREPGWKLRDQFRSEFDIDPRSFDKKIPYPKPAA